MEFAYWLSGFAESINEAPTKGQWAKIHAEMRRQIANHEYKPQPLAPSVPFNPLQQPFPGYNPSYLTVTTGGSLPPQPQGGWVSHPV